jgi:hypothetical protein
MESLPSGCFVDSHCLSEMIRGSIAAHPTAKDVALEIRVGRPLAECLAERRHVAVRARAQDEITVLAANQHPHEPDIQRAALQRSLELEPAEIHEVIHPPRLGLKLDVFDGCRLSDRFPVTCETKTTKLSDEPQSTVDAALNARPGVQISAAAAKIKTGKTKPSA